jgi:C4-type Zn-finger protein
MVTAMSMNTSEAGEQRNQTVRQSRTNIGNFRLIIVINFNCDLCDHMTTCVVVLGEQYREPPSIDLQFPLPDDLVNYTSSQNSTTITIPSSLIEERLREAENGS